ncbi:hypothetical protein J23TS9_08220 [Paenibacillus sp. J23TS9]|nr:hypothetical protein J23TS9_08220 [Paenibacillus sp. J23TS9]
MQLFGCPGKISLRSDLQGVLELSQFHIHRSNRFELSYYMIMLIVISYYFYRYYILEQLRAKCYIYVIHEIPYSGALPRS